MATEKKDLVVLGSGPGGYVAAIRAAQLGRKVTIIERESLGGVCLNWGCIPSKALLRSAQLYHDIKHSATFGFEAEGVKLDFPRVVQRSREVAEKLSGGVTYLMKKNKIEVVSGEGKLLGKNTLSVTPKSGAQQTFEYKDIIIATGARPRVMPGIEVDGDLVHHYRSVLEHKRLPQKILIIGAGAIGMEFGYFFHSFGAQVTVVEMLDQVLPLEDKEVADNLRKIFEKRGMTIKTRTKVAALNTSGRTVSATLQTPDGEERWTGDCCLISIGVIPNTESIGLDAAGIAVDRGFIKVNEWMQTSVPNHYAIGDVTGGVLLAHVASHEGLVAAEHAAGKAGHPMHYDNIPSCTYCQPQVASIGLTEQAVKERGLKYKVGKIPFSAIGKAIAIGEQDGFTKVIIEEETGEVLGVHILHSEATELISEAAIIRSHEGIAASVVETIHPHPTLSESVMEAFALAQGRPINF